MEAPFASGETIHTFIFNWFVDQVILLINDWCKSISNYSHDSFETPGLTELVLIKRKCQKNAELVKNPVLPDIHYSVIPDKISIEYFVQWQKLLDHLYFNLFKFGICYKFASGIICNKWCVTIISINVKDTLCFFY